MQDLQDYQYYDPSPTATPQVWWRRKRTWQLTGLLTLAVGVLILAGITATNVLKNRSLVNSDHSRLQQARSVASQFAAKCQDGDEMCLALANSDAARSLGLVEACISLEADKLADCVSLIAIDHIDPGACEILAGDAKAACADTPYLLKAKQALSIELCAKIVNSVTRAACVSQVKTAAVTSGQCQAIGLDENLCASAQLLTQAIASNDPEACAALNDNDAYVCVKGQQQADADDDGLVAADEQAFGTSEGISDTDGDGLSDGDEVHIYQTNPIKADTDGDSFSDGLEIDSGYNPLT